jgi:hypothetical protein
VIEEDDVRARLPRHTLADGAVTGVVIDRIAVGVSVDVSAPASVLVRHSSNPI